MDEIQFKELMKYVRRIDEKLDIIANFERLSAPKYEPTTEEKKVFDLCNLKNTVEDMVSKTKKKRSNVEVVLSRLRSKGLIRSETRDGKVVYSKI